MRSDANYLCLEVLDHTLSETSTTSTLEYRSCGDTGDIADDYTDYVSSPSR